ncbi:glycoside hydrolase family 43 protein [Pleomassaria siparia CBS 279.74]|uniref:Glycoside hydrolase family 43 protein n=1 Tax=Pleomassaria siparia CBS 279.74 TaxID=1314801 RepID=A0A6G1KH83_9PLEO|nr:glycoside hydrolase family 43 protein [Pleomassaria siparia CBS 279.74]
MSFPGQQHMAQPSYNDHILTITERSCADPYVIWDKGTYYMTFTADGNRVEIWSGDSLFEFEKRCRKDVIWRPPPNTPYTGDVWAPELHNINGQWYVYFAADDPQHGNRTHRTYILSGPPSSSSPLDANTWTYHGPLSGMPDQWAIDGTVLHLHNAMYFVYSGWPLDRGAGQDESLQELFIISMQSPTAVQGAPVRISTPNHPWEFSGSSGINEGPQILCSPDNRWLGIAYSCAGSWTHEYKMGVLAYTGGDPLAPQSWIKRPTPLLRASADDKPPYGPGHGNFVGVNGPGASMEVWAVFHATDAKTGWEGRKARLMRVGWSSDGPFMGRGECGGCCGETTHFLHGCDGGQCGGGAGPRPGGRGGDVDIKKEAKKVLGQAKGLIGKFLK